MSRLSAEVIASFLAQTQLLKGCPASTLGKIAPHLEQRSADAGQVVLAAGSAVSHVGFLLSGRASMHLVNGATGATTMIEELSPGDAFGEVGLLLGGSSPLHVVAEEECATLHLRKELFEQVLNALPSVGQALARRISTRFVKVGFMGLASAGPARGAVSPPLAVPSPPPPGGNAPSGGIAPSVPLGKGEIRFVETPSYSLGGAALEMVPTRLILQRRLLPLELRGKTLVVGFVNPHSVEAVQDLKRLLTVAIEVVAIAADDWAQAVARLKLDLGDRAVGGKGAGKLTYLVEQRRDADKGQVAVGDDIIGLVDRILVEGAERGASDIHIEPEAAGLRVRYRAQGLLSDRKEVIPLSYAAPIAARLKILAELDITERRVPQDGRIVAQLGKRELNFRVSTMATSRGEKLVLRVLDPSEVMRPIEHIFLEAPVAESVQRAIAAPYGAIVVAGPTGSGKSSSLYSLLAHRRTSRPDNNIVTVEDPVEYSFPGITQVSINAKAGIDFPLVLRALMRQDPDVIMIGELRDATTAAITLEAALTGHLVLTTTHGSNVLAVLQRFEHFGAEPMLLSQALNVVVVQRLARKLCPGCVQDEEVAPALVETLVERGLFAKGGQARLPRAGGCGSCERTGYKGRVAVVEVLTLGDEVRAGIANGMPRSEVVARAQAAGHFVSFARSAKLLMARRLLSPADALLAMSS